MNTFSFEDAVKAEPSKEGTFSFEDATKSTPPVSSEYASGDPTEEPQFAAHKKPQGTAMDKFGNQLFGFIGAVKDPVKSMREDSMVAHLARAQAKGTFNKPIGELIKGASQEVADWSLHDLWKAASDEPGRFLGTLVNTITADPELLLAPVGLGGRVADALGKVGGTAGAVAGRALETGVMGGVTQAPISAAQQLDEKGAVDPRQLMQDTGVGAAMGATLGTILHLSGDLSGESPRSIYLRMKEKLSKGKDPASALNEVIDGLNIPEEKSEPLKEAVKNQWVVEKENVKDQYDKTIDKMTKELRGDEKGKVAAKAPEKAPAFATTPKESSKARKELGGMAEELRGKREAEEASNAEWARMREELGQQEAARQQKITQQDAIQKEASLQRMNNLANPEKNPLSQEVVAGSADAARKKLPSERTAADLVALKQEQVTKGERVPTLLETKDGREVHFTHKKNPDGTAIIEAKNNAGQPVGKLEYSTKEDAEGVRLNPSVEVHKDWRRQGVASHMYDMAEEAGGKIPGVEEQAEFRTEAGKAFRANRESRGMKEGLTKGEKEAGFADPTFLKWMTLGGLGAGIGGYWADDKVEGAAIGAALALGGEAARGAATKLISRIGDVLDKTSFGPRDTRFRIDNFRETYQKTMGEHGIAAMRAEAALKRLVPDVGRRSALTHFIQSGKAEHAPRNQQERTYVTQFQRMMEDVLRREQVAGVIGEGIEDGSYVSHYWEGGAEEIKKAQKVFSSMSAKNTHAMQKVVPSYEAGMKAGLKPKTLDSAEIAAMRLEDSGKVIARAQLIKSLKEGVTPEGERLLVHRGTQDGSGAGYDSVVHPQLADWKVHPDIAPSVRLLFSSQNPNAILDGLETVTSALKRSTFSLSMFHPMSLAQAFMGMSRFARTGPRAWSFLPAAHSAWMLKGNEELLRSALVDGGVKAEPRKGVDVEYDLLQKAVQKGIDASEGWLSKGRLGLAAAGAGIGAYEGKDPVTGALVGAAGAFGAGRTALRAYKTVDRMTQKFLWDYLHPVLKVATFGAEYERAMAKNAENAAKGLPTLSKEVLAKEVGSAVNDIYGGIQWDRIAEGVQNKYGRDLALALAQPDSQRLLRLGFMAPDWLASTFRSVVKALPGVSSKTTRAVHQSYVLNSLLMYATMGDALNMYWSGHHLWENKDKTRVDMGDGRTMQLNKHLMETFHLLQDPGQFYLNKRSPLFSELEQQAEGTEYSLSKGRQPPKMKDRLAHVAEKLLPISMKGGSPEALIGGALGLPIYGKTKEEQKSAAAKKKLDKMLQKGSEEEAQKRREKLMKKLRGE